MALEALTPEERRDLLVSIGTHRGQRILSPVEVAALLRKAIDGGTPLAECAKAVQIESPTQLARFLALLNLPADLHHEIDWGRTDDTLSFTAAFELSRLSDPADQQRAVQAVLEYRLSTSETRQLVQAKKRSGKPMDECVQAVLRMRPRVEVRHVFIGSVLNEEARARLKQLSQHRRDEILGEILAAAFRDLRATGRLGQERFTLVGGDELGAAIRARKDQLEQEVNAQLARSLPS